MAGSTPTEAPAAAAPRRWSGRDGWTAALAELLGALEAHRVRRLCWASTDPLAWPFEDAALLDGLAHWARPAGREWVWLGGDFEPLRVHSPRLMRWRGTWDHRLRCLAVDDVRTLAGRELLLAEGLGLIEVEDTEAARGRISVDQRELIRASQWFDAVLQRGIVTFPVTTLGI